jgi:hypothetical protein
MRWMQAMPWAAKKTWVRWRNLIAGAVGSLVRQCLGVGRSGEVVDG